MDLKATISATLFPNKPGCKVCLICADNPGLKLQLIARLASGEVRTKIAAWLKSLGYEVSKENLYRHYNAHVRPWLEPMLQIQREILAEQEGIAELDPDQLAETLGTSLLRATLSAAKRLQLEIIAMSITDAGDAIEFLDKSTKLVKAIADIQRAKSASDLNEQMVRLRELEILAKAGNMDALVDRRIRSLLSAHPAVADRIMKELRPLLAETATAIIPARRGAPLRAPDPKQPHATAKPRPTRRSHQ
jgi:hypothetical protein